MSTVHDSSMPTLATAQTVIEDLGEEVEKIPEGEAAPKTRSRPSGKSSEEREKLKKEKKARK